MQPFIRTKTSVGLVVAAVVLSFTAPANLQVGSSAQVPERESAVCLDCHDEAKREQLLDTPHQILIDGGEQEARVACTDCHRGDVGRHGDDPEEYPLTNPAKTESAVTAGICSACHHNSHQQNMSEGNPHSRNGVRCTDCHQVHGAKRAGLLKQKEIELCYGCHSDVKGEFSQPYRHPVSDEIVRCSDCHASLGLNKKLLSNARIDEACFQCHKYFEGPFPYEHQATIGWSAQEGGCLTCHRPHGSSNPRMLNRPYEPPVFNLCSQCHVVPKHNNNTRHGTEFAGVPCNECHVDIHGSYTNRNFLGAGLQSQGCFNAGCHKF